MSIFDSGGFIGRTVGGSLDSISSGVSGILNDAIGGAISGLFGSEFVPYMRDSRSAAFSFGQYSTYMQENYPRLKFNYFVRIRINPDPEVSNFAAMYMGTRDLELLIPLIKRVDMPGFKVESSILNQYNKKRVSQTKVTFEEVQMVFYDVVDGKSLRFWEMYYEYYFKDGEVLSKLKPSNGSLKTDVFQDDIISDGWGDFETGFGHYSQIKSKYLIESIDIYQVHAGNFSRVSLVHPRITSFKHDSLQYLESTPVEITMSFQPEDVVYYNFYKGYDDSTEGENPYKNSGAKELKMHTVKTPLIVPVRESRDTLLTGAGGVTDTSVLGALERNVKSYIENLPEQVARAASSAIFTGKAEFPINPKEAAKSILTNSGRQITGVGRRTFNTAVTAGVGAVTGVILSPFKDNSRQ